MLEKFDDRASVALKLDFYLLYIPWKFDIRVVQ